MAVVLPDDFRFAALMKFTEGEHKHDSASYLALKKFLLEAEQDQPRFEKAKDELVDGSKINERIEDIRQQLQKYDEDSRQKHRADYDELVPKIYEKLEPKIRKEISQEYDLKYSKAVEDYKINAQHLDMCEVKTLITGTEKELKYLRKQNKKLNKKVQKNEKRRRKDAVESKKESRKQFYMGLAVGLAGTLVSLAAFVFSIWVGAQPVAAGAAAVVATGGLSAVASHLGLLPIHKATIVAALSMPTVQAQIKPSSSPTQGLEKTILPSPDLGANILEEHKPEQTRQTALPLDKKEASCVFCVRPKYKKFSINKHVALQR